MAYTLTKLAPGSYDLWRDGRIIGGVVRGGSDDAPIWVAELLLDVPAEQRPAPFIELEHEFPTLDELCLWLGMAKPGSR